MQEWKKGIDLNVIIKDQNGIENFRQQFENNYSPNSPLTNLFSDYESPETEHTRVDPKDVQIWQDLVEELKNIKEGEMLYRMKIYRSAFKDPVEGTNKFVLDDGFFINCQHKLNRSIEVALLASLREEFEEAGINVDLLVEWEPKLKIKEYRALSDDQRALFDRCLIIKDATPSMEVKFSKKGIK